MPENIQMWCKWRYLAEDIPDFATVLGGQGRGCEGAFRKKAKPLCSTCTLELIAKFRNSEEIISNWWTTAKQLEMKAIDAKIWAEWDWEHEPPSKKRSKKTMASVADVGSALASGSVEKKAVVARGSVAQVGLAGARGDSVPEDAKVPNRRLRSPSQPPPGGPSKRTSKELPKSKTPEIVNPTRSSQPRPPASPSIVAPRRPPKRDERCGPRDGADLAHPTPTRRKTRRTVEKRSVSRAPPACRRRKTHRSQSPVARRYSGSRSDDSGGFASPLRGARRVKFRLTSADGRLEYTCYDD